MVNEAGKENRDDQQGGEGELVGYNAGKEQCMNHVVGGHYATETVGVKALIPLIRETFGVETVFIEDKKDL